jgi:MoxR-like ATPase
MQEHSVTVGGNTYTLEEPFFVLATQNPIELDGTYPLPEAQLDRFLIKATVSGIGEATLARILMERPSGAAPVMTPVCDPAKLRALVVAARSLPVPEALAHYIARLVNATRPELPEASERVKALVRWGASPRAALALAACARARALMDGRPSPGFDDVKAAAVPVMAHRVIPAYEAGLQGVDAPTLVREVMAAVPELA